MAADGFHALEIAPHIVLAPALALSLTLMAFNFLGDGLRDALDPRMKR
jgi:oligopeptide transport system permease protein